MRRTEPCTLPADLADNYSLQREVRSDWPIPFELHYRGRGIGGFATYESAVAFARRHWSQRTDVEREILRLDRILDRRWVARLQVAIRRLVEQGASKEGIRAALRDHHEWRILSAELVEQAIAAWADDVREVA